MPEDDKFKEGLNKEDGIEQEEPKFAKAGDAVIPAQNNNGVH